MTSRNADEQIRAAIRAANLSDHQATLLLTELATQYLGRARAGTDSPARRLAAAALNQIYFTLANDVVSPPKESNHA